jgi:uncharacterized protein
MRNAARLCTLTLCIATLYGCAVAPSCKPSVSVVADSAPVAVPAEPPLVVNGDLTEAGTQVRGVGLAHYQQHRDVQAYAQWRRLADQGHGESLFNMGIMTRDGLGVAADPAEGLAWMRKAAAAGYAQAYFDVGAAYSVGRLVPKDVEEAVRNWRKGAEFGNVQCASAAGRYLVWGIDGASTEPHTGVMLLQRAAEGESSDRVAAAILGGLYLAGKFVAKDYTKARAYLEQATDRCDCDDDGGAMHNLGLIYDRGYGVKIDKKKAFALYQKAAEKQNPAALNNVGYAYRHGQGVRRNLVNATAYFAAADALGNLNATVNLGDMTFRGRGTHRDRARAVALYKKAADGGDAVAQCRYAQALAFGDGVARNLAAAQEFTTLAKTQLPGLSCNQRLERTLK